MILWAVNLKLLSERQFTLKWVSYNIHDAVSSKNLRITNDHLLKFKDIHHQAKKIVLLKLTHDYFSYIVLHMYIFLIKTKTQRCIY